MPSNKDRLYIALYARGGRSIMPGGEDKYHWGILVGPKFENDSSVGKLYHAKEKMMHCHSQFIFEERNIRMLATSMILVRILIGKVKNREWLESILRSIPIREDQTGWNCVSWVQEAVESLAVDNRALGTAVTDWETVRDTLLWYVQQKAAEHRFDGKAEPDSFDILKVATYDLVDAKAETVP